MLKTDAMASLQNRKIGSLAVSPARRRIEGPGGEVVLEPLVMHLLLLLSREPGRVVPRSALFEQLWGSSLMGDDSLNRLVAVLRRALERVGGGIEIETVPRTGYRLIGSDLDDGEPAGLVEARPPVTRRRWLAAAAASLVAAAGAGFIWREHGRREQSSLLVARAQRILSNGIPWELPAAQSSLERAVAIAPDDEQALGLLASVRALAVPTLPPSSRPEAVEETDALIRRTLALSPNNADAKLARLGLDEGTLNWVQYEDRLLAVRRSAPTNIAALDQLTFFYQGVGHARQSWVCNEQRIALDPISPQPQWRKALKSWIWGRNADADRVINRVHSLWPQHPHVWNARLLIYAFTGRAEAALGMINDPASRPRTVTPASMRQWQPTLAALADPGAARVAAAVAANFAAARESPGQAAYAAMALSAIGEVDAAFEVAQGFLLARGPLLTKQPIEPAKLLVNNDGWRRTQWLFTPPMKVFRSDHRFGALCNALSLTDYWEKRGRPDIV